MNHPEKQLKYSIRKVSVGAASVVIGALYLLMGAGIAHAEGVESARETERAANPTDPEQSGNGKTGNKPDLSNTDAAANTYNAPVAENPLVAPEAAKPRRTKRALPDGDASNPSSGATGTESGENQPTGENSPVLDANRKGETVKDYQPGVHVPTDGEKGSDDKNAHLTFDTPGKNATVEYMYKIIQNMPDDFQNNERSYLRNMNTLGDALRFKDGKVVKDEDGEKLQDGEIREINEFGGWKAIDGGTFAIGKKNAQGYFTGWYYKKGSTTEKEQGGMLGSDALDRVYLHEQALDRRFKYMLMLAKGRTIANRTDTAQDGSTFEIKTEKRTGNTLDKLPVKEKEDILQHSPNIEGFNGIEKTFTAFSTKYGSRLKIDFVTGYISDYEGSKGTYRIVVKAIKKDKNDTSKEVEETIYDHTINRIDGVVENEERYSQGVDLSEVNRLIKKLLKIEYDNKVNTLAAEKYKKKYPDERRPNKDKLAALKEEVKQELAKNGDAIVELPVDKDKLNEKTFKKETGFKETFTRYGNDLNNHLKNMTDSEVQKNSPTWNNYSTEKNADGTIKSKDPDRVYKLLDFVLPTAKKIIYHGDTDQLELQTDPEKVKNHREELAARLKTKEASLASSTNEEEKTKLKKEISALKSALGSTNAYTYLEARNGSQEAKILGSHMEAEVQPDASQLTEADYNRIKTNELAAKEKDGLSKFTAYFVEKENVIRNNVISDEELSEKIHAEIGGDNDKLGKGGYFSTGDIPLGKDVVAYKVQVFAENEKRVGVNKQSPRLQYNLPILADFSVIQDTVEPSKEVAKRIIDKQVEDKKIPPEEGKKLKGKIDESKKTSEVRKAISGNVKVKYVDEQGQDIPLSEEDAKKVGEKSDNGTYFVEKEALIGSSYDVTSKKLRGINTGEKKYRLKRSLNDGLYAGSEAVTGSVTSTDKIVTFVYEEGEPAKAKAVVHVKKQQEAGDPVELVDHKLNLETEVGEEFPSKSVEDKVKELQNLGYEIVDNTFTKGIPDSRKGDDKEDKDGEEPTQSYTITVREKVETVTEPKNPNDPVDPNNGEGPKWPETGLKESDLKKEVTRTITYVKKETPDGQEEPSGVENKVDKVLFKRTATYNLVTKKITYGEWTATTDESHPASQLPAVDTPLKTGYVADIKQVEGQDAPKPTETGEVTNIEKKVVYTKLGSWVPKIPGKDSTPIPYPNDPKDPTKPKYPDYPKTPENPDGTPNPQPENPGGNNTPGGGNETPGGETPGTPEKPKTPELPVIPYEPGYTPKIGETPLEPVDPKDPKKGYKVPEIPKDPQNNTIIEYKPNPQKILIKVVNVTTGEEVELPKEKLEFNGVSDQVVTTEDREKVDNKIASLKQRGYIVSTKNPISETTKYDTKDDSTEPTQIYKIVVNELISKDKEIIPVTRTIKYVQIDVKDGKEVKTELNTEKIKTKVDKVEFSRDASTSLTTYITKFGNWDTETKELSKVNTPVLDGYLASVASVENKSVSPDTESYEVTVEYRKIGSWVPKVPGKEEPTPIPYPNDPDDPTKPKTPDYPTAPPQPGQPVPKVPVIPYVPGYTPKTPNGTPLVPIDPEHPEKGYKVPPVPETPDDPKMDTPIKYTPDGQRAIVKFVVVGEDGKETELVASRMSLTGKTGEEIPTENFNDTLKKLTGDPVNNGDYELVDNPLKDGATFDNVKDEEGKDPSQVFVVKLRQIYVIPPTPRIVERPSGNTVEVDVPNKDADTLSITFTKRNSTEKETIVTKKDKDGTWKIEKSPVGVTINPTNGRVYIPSEQVQPKTWVDTQTKHKYKQSKIVSVMPNILDVPKFEGTTEWIDVNGNVLRPTENGFHEKGRIANHVWLESRLEGNKVTHIFFAGSPSVDKPEYKITVWFDKDGNPLKPDQPGTHEAGNIPGYRYITTVTEDGITIHRFEKIPPVLPNEPIPDRPEEPNPQPNPEHPSVPTPSPELPNQETPIPEPTPEPDTPRPETPVSPDPEAPTYETGKREELPNTGTEANAGLAGAGLLTLLAGLGLGFFKKKEEDESE
ncbi:MULTISPECIES: YSIRK-type signal peptide-containing protein [unclassified Streptococcus]|uniref:mucin-binding protein n=1 Tax=unclassified Streptococcus TaxID=2608887 RepID=UPI001564A83B|nr:MULTISPECIES: YSIRK-type signal peptide-containing protein [unclassified Streptococcus]